MIGGLPAKKQPTSCRCMVRSIVSAGVALACSWSALVSPAYGTLVIIDSGNGSNIPPNWDPANPPQNNPPPIVSPGQGDSSNYIRDVIIVETPPPTLPPILFPPQKPKLTAPLTFRHVKGSLVAGRRSTSTFYGLVEGGYVRLVINRGGRGSASVSVNNKRAVIPIKVSESGEVAPVRNASSSGVSISGTLTSFSDGSVGFDAVLTKDSEQTPVRVLKTAPPENFAETVAGRYTLVFENNTGGVMLSSGVTGVGTLRINKSGSTVFTGRLSDGSSFSQGARLNSAGKWALYAKSRTGATLSGNVAFANRADSDCNGALQWTREVGGATQSAAPSLRGSRYSPAKTFGDAAIWNFGSHLNSGEIQTEARLAPAFNNALLLMSATVDETRLRLNRANGTLSGSFIQPDLFPQTASGVVFQKTSESFGLTKQTAPGAAWTGYFTLQKADPQ